MTIHCTIHVTVGVDEPTLANAPQASVAQAAGEFMRERLLTALRGLPAEVDVTTTVEHQPATA